MKYHTEEDERLRFRKSSYSGGGNTNCVEVASRDGFVVRDSKNPGPTLAFSATDWASFVADVRADRL